MSLCGRIFERRLEPDRFLLAVDGIGPGESVGPDIHAFFEILKPGFIGSGEL